LKVKLALPVAGHESIKVHKLSEALRRSVGHAGGYHTAVAVPDQDDITKILELKHAENVGDVRLQSDIKAREMHTLSLPGVGWGEELVSRSRSEWPHLFPNPAR
jgi:hypothetical protein